jgi:hypothetical protein
LPDSNLTSIIVSIIALVSTIIVAVIQWRSTRKKSDADAALSIANAAQVTAKTSADSIAMLRLELTAAIAENRRLAQELDRVQRIQSERAERMAIIESALEDCKRRRQTDDVDRQTLIQNMYALLQYARSIYNVLTDEQKAKVEPPPDTDKLKLRKAT